MVRDSHSRLLPHRRVRSTKSRVSGRSPGGCSPHPQGWSSVLHTKSAQAVLLPAPVGMVPP